LIRLLKNRQLPAFKVGSDWRFNIERIDEWRMEKTILPEREPGN
jgi:excisionase family DNA binding protein